MRLIKSTIVAASVAGQHPAIREQSRLDYQVCGQIAGQAQTIIFSSEQMMALRPALNRYEDGVDYRLPFQFVILQFDRPIPEAEFMRGARNAGVPDEYVLPAGEDTVSALVLAQHETGDGQVANEAIAYYGSSSINRALWIGTGDEAAMVAHGEAFGDDAQYDKRAIRRMATAAIAYINCVNIKLESVEAPAAVNRKRRKKGKRELEPYYIISISDPTGRQSEATGSGVSHSYRYDVRGHFRRLSDGRVIWVHPHQRGLEHELYKPKTYRRR